MYNVYLGSESGRGQHLITIKTSYYEWLEYLIRVREKKVVIQNECLVTQRPNVTIWHAQDHHWTNTRLLLLNECVECYFVSFLAYYLIRNCTRCPIAHAKKKQINNKTFETEKTSNGKWINISSAPTASIRHRYTADEILRLLFFAYN